MVISGGLMDVITTKNDLDFMNHAPIINALEEMGFESVEINDLGDKTTLNALVVAPCQRQGGRLYDFTFEIIIPAENDTQRLLATMKLYSTELVSKRHTSKDLEVMENIWIQETPHYLDELIEWLEMLESHLVIPSKNKRRYKFLDHENTVMKVPPYPSVDSSLGINF
jgi:hypothetical protein